MHFSGFFLLEAGNCGDYSNAWCILVVVNKIKILRLECDFHFLNSSVNFKIQILLVINNDK